MKHGRSSSGVARSTKVADARSGFGFGFGTTLAADAGTAADAIATAPSAGRAGVDRVVLGILRSRKSRPTRKAYEVLGSKITDLFAIRIPRHFDNSK